MTQLALKEPSIDGMMVEVAQTQELCQKLMETKHYAKMGPEGVFAIVQKAKSLNMNPLDALNGGLYYFQGKVEMSAQAMNQLIRQAGHSVKKDESRSNNSICILLGKRKDNGDTWTESFSIDEAKAAGIYKSGGAWSKYPRDMLFARALSRLARQLFPDVIKGCYVQGEISDAPPLHEPVENVKVHENTSPKVSNEQVKVLEELLNGHDNIREKVMEFVQREGGKTLADIQALYFDKIEARIRKLIQEKEDMAKVEEIEQMDQEEVEDYVETSKKRAQEIEECADAAEHE